MIRLAVAVVMLCSLSVMAEDGPGKTQERGKAKLAVNLVEIKVCRRLSLPVDFPRDALTPVDPPALELVFLIGGEHLTAVKHQTLELKKFQTAKKRDLLQNRDKPAYEQMYAHLFLPPAQQGNFQSFAIGSNALPIEELEGTTLQGVITVSAAEGKQTFASKPLMLSGPSKLRIQDFAVSVAGEVDSHSVGPLGSGAFAPEGDSPEPLDTSDAEAMTSANYLFAIEGDLGNVIDVEVVQGDKKLEQVGFNRSDDRGEFEYRKASNEECVIQIHCWKNRREVVVPFEATLSMKTK